MVCRLSILVLVFAFPWVSVELALADEPTTRPSVDEKSAAEIKALIEQLGDRDVAKRDAAAKRLIEIGPAAKAQLEAASKSESELDLIRRRAKMLLLSIVRREKVDPWSAFVSGKSPDGPSGWKKFRKIVGDTPDARKLFVDMYRAEPKLLETYATDPAKAASLIEPLCEARDIYSEGFEDLAPVSPIFSIVTYLLIAGDKDAKVSGGAAAGLLKMTGLASAEEPELPFVVAIKAGPSKPLLRKLVSRWLNGVKFDDGINIVEIMLAAQRHEFKEEGLRIALDTLNKLDGRQHREADLGPKYFALYTVGKFGDAAHIERIEPLLERSDVLRELESGEEILVCDAALAVLVHLTRQKAKDYGLKNFDETIWTAKGAFSFLWMNFHFASNAGREKAMSQWREWRKQNPTPTPELNYSFPSVASFKQKARSSEWR